MPVKYRLCSKQTHTNLLHTQKHERHSSSTASESQPVGCGPCVKYQACFLGLSEAPLRLELAQLLTLAFWGPLFFLFSGVCLPDLQALKLECAQKQLGYLQQLQIFQLHTRDPLWAAEERGNGVLGNTQWFQCWKSTLSTWERVLWRDFPGSPRILTLFGHGSCLGARVGPTEGCLSLPLNFDIRDFHKCAFLKMCGAKCMRIWTLES